jgi:hypothetical protein
MLFPEHPYRQAPVALLEAVSKPLLSGILTFLESVPFERRVKKISPIVGVSRSIEIFSGAIMAPKNGKQKRKVGF